MADESIDWEGAARVTQLLARVTERPPLIELALTALTEVGGAEAAAIWLYEATGGRLSPAGERGLPTGATDHRPAWSDLFKLPLASGGLLVGVLEAYTSRAGGFTDAQRAVLQMVGGVLALSLHRCRLADDLRAARGAAADRRRLDELELLDHLRGATARALSYPELFEQLTDALRERLPFDAAALLLPAGGVAEAYVTVGGSGHRGLLVEVVSRAAEALVAFGAPPPLVDLEHVRLHGPEAPDDGPPLATGFAVPLTADDEAVAVIYFGALDSEAFTEAQIHVLHAFAERASEAMERVRALLRVELERLETIIQSLPQGVVLLDASGRRLMGNRHGGQFVDRLTGRSPCVSHLGEHPLEELLLEAIGNGTDLTRRELELRDGDAATQLAVTVVAVRDEDELLGAVLSIEDVTEIRQTQQRLFHDARLASVGELASGLAHELNNPLMILLGIAEVLADDPDLPESKRPLLEDMQSATLRTAEIVQQLMVFADTQADAGVDAFDLPEVLEQAVALVSAQCERDGVDVQLEWAGDLPMVQGNAGQLQQILLVLLRNAYEAIVHSGHGSHVAVRAYPADGTVVMEVEDDGPGVPDALKERVFDVFFSTKRDHQGKGLGLAIAHRYAQELGSALELDDAPGGGARFRLRLVTGPYRSTSDGDDED